MVLSNMETRAFHPTTFKIPRKERRPSEDCQYTLPVDSREAKDIENAVKRQTWDLNDLDRAVSISQIKKVDNPNLEREYHEKRAELRHNGRSLKELSEHLAFCVETEESRVKEICRSGLECNGVDHTLGDGSMGVTVWKCPDLCLKALHWPSSRSAYLIVSKVVKGRVKSVMPRLSSDTPHLEPTPNHDCHTCRNTTSSSVTDFTTLLRNTQYYLYEYNDEGLPSLRPRQCLPFAVIHLKRNELSSPRSPKLRSLMSLEKPLSPGKEHPKHVEECKSITFSDEAGILAWRGLVMSGGKSLGLVSLLAGHKLGFNFMKSYLDVSRKIPLTQLAKILPGDVKCAWNFPLIFRGHTLSLCTMKPAQGQTSESFASFTRGLVIKAKSAGVLCIDPSTTMFLLPSCKLAVYLGFCETESPPRVFCIICRRQTTVLSPRSVWPLTRPFTPPFNSRAAHQSNTGTSAGYESTVIEPSFLDFKTKHKAKIVVSSTEKSPRLSPKRPSLRQGVKRSLSFSYSSPKDATKPLQRTARSASSPERLRFQDDSARPKIQSEISRYSDERKRNSIANDSQIIGCGLREEKSLNLDSVEDGENSQEISTGQLEEGLKISADTQESLSTELTRLVTLRKQKDTANCTHSYSESEQPLVKHTNINTSPNVLSVSFSSQCRKERLQTGELVETPSVVADEFTNDPCLSNETGSRTLTNTTSLPDISQLDAIWDLHDNLQTVDMEISESLPSSITVRQAYCFSIPHAFNEVSKAQASLEKVMRSKTILPTKATNQNDFIVNTVSPTNDQLVVLCDTKSPDTDSTNCGDGVELREPDSHDIVRCVDMSISTDDESEMLDKNDGSQTLDRNPIWENHNVQSAMLTNSQLLKNSSTKNSDWSKSLSIDEGAHSRQQNVPSTYKRAEAGGTDSEMSLDCVEGTVDHTLSCDLPYSFKSSPDTVENQSKPRTSVLSESAANTLVQKNCSLDGNTSLSTSCAQSCGKVSDSSWSPRKSPKLCIERLKALQGALKTATGLNANQPDRNTGSPCKLVIHPQNTKEPEPDKDCVGCFDSMGVSVTEHGSEGKKPPMFGLSAVETQDAGIPTKSQPCEGGVIEMSLIEDWGFLPGFSSSNKTHLAEDAFGLLDMEEEEYEIDSIEGDSVVEPFETGPYIDECDIPEPEVVVCSPSEPMETFTFRFPGIPAVDEDENVISETIEDKTHLVEESLVVPEFCTEVVVSSSENFVSEVDLPEESSLENESEIPESVVVVEGDKVDSIVCVSQSSQNLANGCLSKLPKKDVFFSGDAKKLENTGSKQQCSERLEECEKVCLGPLLKSDEQQMVEIAKAERPVSQPFIFKVSQMVESTKDGDVPIHLNSDREPCEITKQKRSASTLEDVLQVQMDDVIVGGLEVELPARDRKGEYHEVSLPNVQETEKGSGYEGLLSEIQVKRNGTDDEREETVTSEEKEEVDNRCSVMTLPEARDPGYSIEVEKQDCLVKGKEMTSRDITIGDESEAMHFSTSSPRLLQAETNLTHNKTVEGKSERLKNTEKLRGKAKEEGREINHETESKSETEKESCPDNVSSTEREEESRRRRRSTSQNRVEKTKYSDFFLNCHIVENSEELEPVKDITKSPVQSVRKSNFGNVESKSVSSATTTLWTVKSLDRSGTTGMGNNETNETFFREHLKQEPLESAGKNLVSSTPKSKTRKKERKVNNSFSVVPSPRESKVETAKDDTSSSKLAEKNSKTEEVKKPSERKSAVVSDTVKANVKCKDTEKGDKLGTNIVKSAGTSSVISPPLSSNRKSDAQALQVKSKVSHQGVYYQDTKNKIEPLIDMQWDDKVRSMKRKCTEEGYILAKQPKLTPTHNEAVENRGTLKNLTPPPPLVSLDRKMNRSQQVHGIGMPRAMLCESNIRDPRIHRPYPGRPQFQYMSPTVHYYNERKYFKANTEQHSYPCWASPLSTPFPVNNRGTEIPPKPWWYQQRGVMPHDHRANRQRFDPVYWVHGNCGVPVPQPGNLPFPPKPGLLPNPWKPGLLPDPWLPRSNPCYTTHPLVTPR